MCAYLKKYILLMKDQFNLNGSFPKLLLFHSMNFKNNFDNLIFILFYSIFNQFI